MTKEEAQTRLDQVIRAWGLYIPSEVPNGYALAEKQPYSAGMPNHKLYKPIYTESEKIEIAELNAIIRG